MSVYVPFHLQVAIPALHISLGIEDFLKENPYKEMSGGPCVKALDKVLQQCHVQRQAYHGKSFVGNHFDRMLKVFYFLEYKLRLSVFKFEGN